MIKRKQCREATSRASIVPRAVTSCRKCSRPPRCVALAAYALASKLAARAERRTSLPSRASYMRGFLCLQRRGGAWRGDTCRINRRRASFVTTR